MAKDEKQARLAAALRDNLRRRKAQARGGGPARPDPPSDGDAEAREDQPLK